VVSNFIVQALKNEPITIYGDGQQTRSFCYVDDLIDAFVAFMATPAELTGPAQSRQSERVSHRRARERIIAGTGSARRS
jgi:UDP-glucuronate decarboxylase